MRYPEALDEGLLTLFEADEALVEPGYRRGKIWSGGAEPQRRRGTIRRGRGRGDDEITVDLMAAYAGARRAWRSTGS